MLRIYPQLRGKVDLLVENEIKNAFNSLYDVVQLLADKAGINLDVNTPASPSATINRNNNSSNNNSNNNNSVGLNNQTFSQPILNQGDVLQTQLQTIVPKSVLKSDFEIAIGAVPVGGTITLITLDGKSQQVLIP